jgi:uncharacterized membrane protein
MGICMEIYEASTSICSSSEHVWSVMSDVERWPQWLPTVSSVRRLGSEGMERGARFRVAQPGFPQAEWAVTSVWPNRFFTWQSRSPGLRIVADHILTEEPDGSTYVLLRLSFDGILGKLASRLTRSKTQQYLAQEAAALKREAEAALMAVAA